MKKKVFILLITLVLVISTVMAGCSSTPEPAPAPAPAPAPQPTQAAAPTITLKYGDQNPDSGWEGSQAAQPWLDQITAATNGRVQFETYYAQSLFKGTDSWEAVKNGVGDMAWMFHGYWANKTTLADVVSLPMMPFTSAKQASGILWQLYEKYPNLRKQFDENHVLITWTSQPYFLITTNKQVKTLDDWKGLKIRVTSGPPIEMMKALGATPVTMGMPDTYLGLERGTIDGMLVPWEAMLSFRHFEVVKYYTYAPLVTVYFTQAMNKNSWEKLPDDVKAQIESVSGLQGSLFWGENMFDTAAAAGREEVKKLGLPMEEYTVPEEELDKWSEIAGQPLWDEWVKARTAEGFTEAQEILDTTIELIKTYNP